MVKGKPSAYKTDSVITPYEKNNINIDFTFILKNTRDTFPSKHIKNEHLCCKSPIVIQKSILQTHTFLLSVAQPEFET